MILTKHFTPNNWAGLPQSLFNDSKEGNPWLPQILATSAHWMYLQFGASSILDKQET